MTNDEHRKAKKAAKVFGWKMDAAGMTDAAIRLHIKTLRGVLLERQQRRATDKYRAKS